MTAVEKAEGRSPCSFHNTQVVNAVLIRWQAKELHSIRG